MKLSVFWFRRDLRLEDNTALNQALSSGLPVLPVFIFDQNIIEELPRDDARISFIYDRLQLINRELNKKESSLKIFKGQPVRVWENIISNYEIDQVFINRDYEPYALQRDAEIRAMLSKKGIKTVECKDQVIFEGSEILKDDGSPYSVYTPYKKRWLQRWGQQPPQQVNLTDYSRFLPSRYPFPALSEIGFHTSQIKVRDYDLTRLDQYAVARDLPGKDSTTYLSPHLRFGTISIRQVLKQLGPGDDVFLGELIWREFFMQILEHFPKVVDQNFNPRYNGIEWRNDDGDFTLWCQGKTGYPLVDAGMRQLNTTGYMHNRVRMVTASFLCKHLLIDWRWGEGYFAGKLLDYELSSNNGNWQWVAGTGYDAVPYFRIFNPDTQQKKFDKNLAYIKKWLPEFETPQYPHQFARERALQVYKKGLQENYNEST
jgi:deoxyribodipyrimidine photo-lyase